MPELPEVEVVRRGLADHVVGRTIQTAQFTGTRVTRRYLPGPVDLADRLSGALVCAAQRRGKYLWLVLEEPDGSRRALVIHLGMSGQLLVQAPTTPRQSHLHATFDFADHGSQLRFVDQRTFGAIALSDLVPDLSGRAVDVADQGTRLVTCGVPATIAHIAPDPLEPAFDRGAVLAILRVRHTAIKRALLDQGLISGIGNIYADETLWRTGVHGEREACAMSKPVLGRLIQNAQEVMLEALGQGGTSFDALYVNVNGASGFFDRSLDVYGRQGAPCHRCGTLIRRERFMNRSSYFCPVCQLRPRTVGQASPG
jgi:formamidopyrimidine-DNA glycosylase